MFVLSISEINRYNTTGLLNRIATTYDGTPASWWTRTQSGLDGFNAGPPETHTPVPVSTVINTEGTVTNTLNNATTAGFRPAMWVEGEPVPTPAFPVDSIAVGSTFTDSHNVSWQVLHRTPEGHSLIITEQIHGLGTAVGQTGSGWTNSPRVHNIQNSFFADMAPELRNNALRTENAFASEPSTATTDPALINANLTTAWTTPIQETVTGQTTLFSLSLSEFNQYTRAGTLTSAATAVNGVANPLWTLRTFANTVESTFTGGTISINAAGDVSYDPGNVNTWARFPGMNDHHRVNLGWRPAMWVINGGVGAFVPPTMPSALPA